MGINEKNPKVKGQSQAIINFADGYFPDQVQWNANLGLWFSITSVKKSLLTLTTSMSFSSKHL